jgi:uncharacterized protein (TIGR00369 family)
VADFRFQRGLLPRLKKPPIEAGTRYFETQMTAVALPEGAEEIPFVGYNKYIGPMYGLPDAGGLHRFCFRVEDRHMNCAGTVHGGMLMSLADIAMSRAARAGTDAQNSSTVSLSCDFVGPGKLGDVIEARVRVTRRTRTIVFVSADIVSGGRTLLVASGVWKIA